jgi:dTDP-4-dehydrorhamnose reductase
MKVLVTGARGMLGSDLCPIFDRQHQLLATDLEEMDVRDPGAVFRTFQEFKPRLVLHLAALTNVDGCQEIRDQTFLTNAVGTKNIALASAKVGAAMVYISTGSVFDGTKSEPYTEFDRPNPRSEYSKAKYQGELAVRELVREHYIVRAGWMFGGGHRDKKFVGKIISLARQGKALQVVDDKFGSPTYTRDMAEGILKLIETGWYGTYHLANEGCCSRYEYACKVLELAGIEGHPVKPVSSEAFPLPAPRPRMEAIRDYLLQLLQLRWMRPWEEALQDYIHNHLQLADENGPEKEGGA